MNVQRLRFLLLSCGFGVYSSTSGIGVREVLTDRNFMEASMPWSAER